MGTAIGVTSERAQQIEDATVVEAELQGNDLILKRFDGTVINVGQVIPPIYQSYPVDSIYLSTRSANPSTYMGGGTWVRWGKGRVPVSVDESQPEFNTVEEVGGSKTHTLTARQSGLRAHIHGLAAHVWGWSGIGTVHAQGTSAAAGTPSGTQLGTVHGEWNKTQEAEALDALDPHNIMQPYITVYMWKRTA